MTLASVTSVGGIDGFLGSVPEWGVQAIRAVNETLDGSMPITMAAVALAAGVFAAGAAGTLDSSQAAIRANKGLVEKTAQARLTNLRSATTALFMAFFAFLICLVTELAADAGLAANAESLGLSLRDCVKFLVAGGAAAWGLICMVKAANLLRKTS